MFRLVCLSPSCKPKKSLSAFYLCYSQFALDPAKHSTRTNLANDENIPKEI